MYSAGVACYAICIHCLLLLGRFDAREGGRGEGRERDGIVVARQPFRRYRAVDNEDSCSWKFARVVWPVFYRNTGNLVFTFRVSWNPLR